MTHRDYSALTRDVAPGEVKAFREWARTSGWVRTTRPPVSAAQVVFVVLFVVFLLVILAMMASIAGSVLSRSVLTGAGVLAPIVLLGLVAATAVAAWRGWTGTAATWEKRLRLREFASVRGCSYGAHLSSPAYPGLIFDIGTDRRSYDSVRATSGRALDVANYRYTVKRDKSSTVYRWG
ncbi:MAG: hypothetical protein ABWY57_12555, partial [Mycetocola sp.]